MGDARICNVTLLIDGDCHIHTTLGADGAKPALLIGSTVIATTGTHDDRIAAARALFVAATELYAATVDDATTAMLGRAGV